MFKFRSAAVAAFVAFGICGAFSGAAHAGVIGPTPYLSFADSPFNPANYSQFFLEDFEDGLFNTPGVTDTQSFCITNNTCFVGGLVDSVGNGGDQTKGHSLWSGSGSVTLVFDTSVTGSLPTAAGLVWTDGQNPITFEAFDQNGVSLGVIVGNHADNNFSGGTAEDRFYGATNAGGISKLVIFNPPAIEIDHVQFGYAPIVKGGVPEPSSWALMLVGAAGLGAMLRGRRRRALA